ncbi:hypothetical protein [Streptomyces zaomyceticus]|uniref:hypothetical protein n=1 Tax=Streptomyces zaomyceticus TaxID=68286 RepID=UPI002E1D9EF3
MTLAYGEQFWPQVHRALREVGDPPPVNERLDLLAFHASRSAGENLVEPFQKWGVSLSDAGIRRINALSLPGATYDPRKLREPSA